MFPWLMKNVVTLDYTIYGVVYNPIGNTKQLLIVKFIVSVLGVIRMMHGCHIITQLHSNIWSISRDYKANPVNNLLYSVLHSVILTRRYQEDNCRQAWCLQCI